MNFRPLFDLRVKHLYYRDGRCADFEIDPDAETRQFVRNQRAILKAKADGMQLILALDPEGKPVVPLMAKTVLRFHLRLRNPDFMLFSDPSNFPASAIPVYSNDGLAQAESTELVRAVVAVAKPVNYFSRVDIHIDSSLTRLSNIPRQFELTFEPKAVRWHYYFVTNLKNDGAQFQIRDTRADAVGAPITFRSNDADDPVSEMLAGQYPDMQHMQFVSEQSVPCRQEAKKTIQLFLGAERLIENLPNPSLHNFSTLETQSDDGVEFQNSLFHIVKYIAHPYTTNGT